MPSHVERLRLFDYMAPCRITGSKRSRAERAAEHSGAWSLAEAGFQAYVVDPTSSSVGQHWQPPKAVQSIEMIRSCSYGPAASQGRRFVASDGALLCRHFRVWSDDDDLPRPLPVKRIAMLLPCYVSATDLLPCVAMLLPWYCHVDEIWQNRSKSLKVTGEPKGQPR